MMTQKGQFFRFHKYPIHQDLFSFENNSLLLVECKVNINIEPPNTISTQNQQ
jgi:hypothetical protein